MSDIPVIDVGDLAAAGTASPRRVAAEIGRACREVGFFYVRGHGIPDGVASGVFNAARAVFALPDRAKQALSIARSPHNRGYVGFGAERLDERGVPDQKEAFNVGLELPPDDPELLAGKAFRGVNLWPDLPGWRARVLAYYDSCMALALQLHRGFALDLGLDEDFFAEKLDRPAAVLRLLRYPCLPGGEASLGAGAHTDYGNLTILATDGVAGLEVRRRDGAWIAAPHVEGAMVCNIGDCLMRWTNDVYVSTPHRVRRPARERYSVAFFADANPDAVVAALPGCIPAGEAARYPPITAGDYLARRLAATYV